MTNMLNYQIDIDGSIGQFEYSKEYVANKLLALKGKPVLARISSNGGSLVHGLAMADRIQEHGDVTIHLMGFNASAATLATLKAKKVCMAANGFYLIHKVMSPVDIWENLNADQMEELIAELMADKLENDKIDQVLAQMYADKTGKSIAEIMDLMKIGGWLNAKEAKDMGFVDEILKTSEIVNMKSMEAKLNAFGLPTNRINTENLFTTKNNYEMKKQFDKVNAVIGVDKLESDDEGVFLNEIQIESIETKIKALENNVSTHVAANEVALNRATIAENAVEANVTKITELETQISNLKKGAGTTTNPVIKDADDTVEEIVNENTVLFKKWNSSKLLYNQIPD